MLSQELHTLVVSTNNRNRQRCPVEATFFETTVGLIITQKLSHDGEVVAEYCRVQCGAPGEVLGIQIDSRMVHQ